VEWQELYDWLHCTDLEPDEIKMMVERAIAPRPPVPATCLNSKCALNDISDSGCKTHSRWTVNMCPNYRGE